MRKDKIAAEIILQPSRLMMVQKFTANYKKRGRWYLGWVEEEEIPGVNTQGKTLQEPRENLKEALSLISGTNRLLVQKEKEFL